jgi:hypothetical protein
MRRHPGDKLWQLRSDGEIHIRRRMPRETRALAANPGTTSTVADVRMRADHDRFTSVLPGATSTGMPLARASVAREIA